MKIVHALEPLQKSIFLAGPTPRDSETSSWRPEALNILELIGFDGTVFVPESNNWMAHDNYDAQIRWEWEAINQSTVVVFWIPRDLVTMPAFTTNVEFGLTVASTKAILGFPPDAPKMSYLKALAERFNVPTFCYLDDTLIAAKEMANKRIAEAVRRG